MNIVNKSENDKESRTVEIDFDSGIDTQTYLPVLDKDFELPKQTGLLGSLKDNYCNVEVSIKHLLGNNACIIFDKNEKPFLCSYNGKTEPQSKFLIDEKLGKTMKISVVFNPKAIVDFSEELNTDREYELPFVITITKGDKSREFKDKIYIRARALKPELIIDYEPWITELVQFEQKGLIQVGTLKIKHSHTVRCAPALWVSSLQIMAFCGELQWNESPFKLEENICNRRLNSEDKCLSIPIFWDSSIVEKNPVESLKYSFSIGKVYRIENQNVVVDEVQSDMGTLTLKPNEENIRLVAKFGRNDDLRPIDDDLNLGCCVLRQNWKTTFNVKFESRGGKEILFGNTDITMSNVQVSVDFANENDYNRITFYDGYVDSLRKLKVSLEMDDAEYSNLTQIYTDVVRGNKDQLCVVNNELIQIIKNSNLYQGFKYSPENINKELLNNGKLKDKWKSNLEETKQRLIEKINTIIQTKQFEFLRAMFDVEGLEENFILKRGESKQISIKINLDMLKNTLPDVNEEKTSLEVKFTIAYTCIMPDETSEKFKFEKIVEFQKEPDPSWMCVDFGTSAIVACTLSENIRFTEPNLVNLKQTKDSILQIWDNGKKKNDDEEAPFISSIASLNSNYFVRNSTPKDYRVVTNDPTEMTKAVDDYKKYPILFSPGQEIIENIYRLPCLKTMVGHETLPNIFGDNKDLRTWKYIVNGNERNIALRQNDRYRLDGEFFSVYNILESVYKQLFTHYIVVDNNNRRNINKLVLTVPNTYTPLEKERIRKIARSVIPEIYPEYLELISESDAVACYYLSQRNSFRNKEKINPLCENVLIYDMGAGTLDLTLVSLKTGEGVTTIDYKAKVGVNKAGNYLDYLIAEILKEFYKKSSSATENGLELISKAINYNTTLGGAAATSLRKELKDFVKDNVKKSLSGKSLSENVPKLKLSSEEIDFNVTFGKIIEHDSFKKFIKQITTDVLTNIVPKPDEINTVIFSGRSTELNAIRKGVAKYFEGKPIVYADICEKCYNDDINLGKGNHEELKTVVSLGALKYAMNFRDNDTYTFIQRANYAAYGIITWDDNHKKAEWHVLLDKGYQWLEDENELFKEINITNPNGLQYIALYQTYLNDPRKIQEDYMANNFDMLSELCVIPTDMYKRTIGIGELNIRFTYTRNNIINLIVNKNAYVEIKPREDFNDDNLRKSLWPVVWNVNR